jgi:hypothetical protein
MLAIPVDLDLYLHLDPQDTTWKSGFQLPSQQKPKNTKSYVTGIMLVLEWCGENFWLVEKMGHPAFLFYLSYRGLGNKCSYGVQKINVKQKMLTMKWIFCGFNLLTCIACYTTMQVEGNMWGVIYWCRKSMLIRSVQVTTTWSNFREHLFYHKTRRQKPQIIILLPTK